VRDGVSTVFVCVTCRREGDAPAEPRQSERSGAKLYAALKAQAGDLDVVPVECLSNCTRSCTVAVTATGKWTYVVGDLDPVLNVDDMLNFARAHKAAADGLPAWRERPVHVRKHTIARVPPMRPLEELK
jgi:predicted metal-binding protein